MQTAINDAERARTLPLDQFDVSDVDRFDTPGLTKVSKYAFRNAFIENDVVVGCTVG